MYRKTLTDGTGRFFDADNAELLAKVQKSQEGDHEESVWYTAKGMFVLEKVGYGQSQDEQRDCLEITPTEAVAWLCDNGIDVPPWFEHLGGEEV